MRKGKGWGHSCRVVIMPWKELFEIVWRRM